MNAQEFEDKWDRKVKFASIDREGNLVQDAHDEYNIVFLTAPEGWVEEAQEDVMTRSEGQRRAWIFPTDKCSSRLSDTKQGLKYSLT
jgi:hypothetical protein